MNRRALLGGLAALVAAPAIVRYANIMPVRSYVWTRSGLWVSVLNKLTMQLEEFPAQALVNAIAELNCSNAEVEFLTDRHIVFDKVTIGRDEHALLHGDVQAKTMFSGDSCRVAISLDPTPIAWPLA